MQGFSFRETMKLLRLYFALLSCLFLRAGMAQDCEPDDLPFEDGEKLDYIVYYNYKNLWVPAGDASFEVHDTTIRSKQYLHLLSYGSTHKKFDWFFKVRDKYQSIVNPETLEPIRFIRDVEEGSYELHRDYVFNQAEEEAYAFTTKSSGVQVDTVELEACVWDVITAIFYTRTIDFASYNVGDEIPIKLVMDKQIYHTELIYSGETTYTAPDDTEYNCLKFGLRLIEGTLFKAGSEMEVIVTNDENKIPLYVESEILVGSIKVYLVNMENIKYELTSKIE